MNFQIPPLLLQIIALFSSIFGIWAYFYEAKPEITYKEISNYSVLEIREEIPDLDVFYQSKDIIKDKLDIRIIEVLIENTGAAPILNQMYDPFEPFSIEIKLGNPTLKPQVISSNDEYLLKHLELKPDSENPNKFIFNKVTFEDGASYKLKFVITHKNDVKPKILLGGKIASIDEFIFIGLDREINQEGFFEVAFHGGAIDNILKAPFFSFLLIIFLLLMVLIIALPLTIYQNSKRALILRAYLKYHEKMFNSNEEKVSQLYKNERNHVLSVLRIAVDKRAIKKPLSMSDLVSVTNIGSDKHPLSYAARNKKLKQLKKNLEESGLLLIDAKGQVRIAEDVLEDIEPMINYLVKKDASLSRSTIGTTSDDEVCRY